MKVVLMSREYPPHVYGGAGVHVTELARHLAGLMKVEVRCFGDGEPRPGNPAVRPFAVESAVFADNPHRVRSVLAVLDTCVRLNAPPVEADVVHCHTWYSMWAGMLARIGYGVPLVVTVHSLEPLRPWKREQLGRGYDISRWIERQALEMAEAVIAVSESDRAAIAQGFAVDERRLEVIPNGIDTGRYRPLASRGALARYGIDDARPYVLFLGRLSRQKGVDHFAAAIRHLDRRLQAVLCAWPPDTTELLDEVEEQVSEAQEGGRSVIWIREQVPEHEAVELYSNAAVFCCPSVYEPFGIINLEAMACETPVVASRVGGIPETVIDGETGFLVDFERAGGEGAGPVDPEGFARDLALRINQLVDDPSLAEEMGRRGRRHVAASFSWRTVAERVAEVYRRVAGGTAL